MKLVVMLLSLIALCGCGASLPAIPPPSSTSGHSEQFKIDQKAFLRARKAPHTESWNTAVTILEQIDTSKIDDVEVIEFVVFSLKCAQLAKLLGIPRSANPNDPWDVIAKMNKAQFALRLGEIFINDPAKISIVLAEALDIQAGIPRYLELNTKLNAKYGSEILGE